MWPRRLTDRRLWAVAAHGMVALGLSFLPLFRGLGFERAAVTGAVTAVVAVGWAGAAPHRSVWLRFGEVALGSCVLLAGHALAGAAVEWTHMPCDQRAGLGWLLLLGGGSCVYGAALGAALKASNRIATGLACAGAVAAHGAAVLVRLYAEPQVRVYSSLFGHWPGSIYDEALEIGPTLWAHRAFAVALAGVWLGSRWLLDRARWRKPKIPPAAVVVSTLSIAVFLFARGESLGFRMDRSTLEKSLSTVVTTEHFRIHLPREVSEADARAVAKDHEFRHRQLRNFFGKAPQRRIRSWVFASVEQKARLTGLANTQMARPWSLEIFLHGVRDRHPTLKHELAHVFASVWSNDLLRVPAEAGVGVNLTLVEGVAVAADDRPRPLGLHEAARAMRELGVLPDLENALSPQGFWSRASARAYGAAGSFVAHLMDARGRPAVARVYRTNNFEAAFDAPLAELVAEWHRRLDGVTLEPSQRRWAEHRYRGASIFQKTCPHETANLRSEGFRALSAGKWDRAEAAFDRAYRFNPDPGSHLALARRLVRADRTREADRVLDELPEALPTARHADLRSRLRGQIAWLRGRTDAARTHFEAAQPTDFRQARMHAAQLAGLTRTGTVGAFLARYLSGQVRGQPATEALARWTAAEPEDPLLAYLYARRAWAAGKAEAARTALERALQRGLKPPLSWEAERMLARIAWHGGNPQDALQRLRRTLSRDPPTEVRARLEQMEARIRFDRDWSNRSVSVTRSAT